MCLRNEDAENIAKWLYPLEYNRKLGTVVAVTL